MSVFDSEAAIKCFRMLAAAASDNATNAVNRPCALKGIQGYNAKAANVFIKLYDETSTPVSTDTPVKTICVPASTAFSFEFSEGFVFATGLGYRMTAAVADNDATALVANDILAFNIDYV